MQKPIGFISKYKVLLGIVALIIFIIILLSMLNRPNNNNLKLSGRLEGYETDISPKYGGEISYIIGREGHRVKQGELLVKIDDSELKAQLKAAEANIVISQQQEKQAQLQLSVINDQIKQAKYTVSQSQFESAGTVQQAKAALASSQSQYQQAKDQLNQAQSDYNLAAEDFRRYTNLLRTSSVSKQVYDQAKTRYENAQANLQLRTTGINISTSQIEQAQALVIQSNSSTLSPNIRQEQVSLLESQLKQARTQLEAAKSSITQSKANRQEILAKMAYLKINSPINGVIIARTSEPGEVVSPGKTILTLLNYNSVYMRGYIPEGKIGLIRIGQAANVYLDSMPDTPIKAFISEIDVEASFTPENIYFQEDRVKQVFGIKLNIPNPEGYAKPGMPADAEILLAENLKKARKRYASY